MDEKGRVLLEGGHPKCEAAEREVNKVDGILENRVFKRLPHHPEPLS